MKPTNNIISHDATSVLYGDYIIAGIFLFAVIFILGIFVYFTVKGLKDHSFLKENLGNTIAFAAFSVVGIAILTAHVYGGIIPLKEQIAKNEWKIEEDYCLSKRSGAIPNVEEYEVNFQFAGSKRVSRETYKKVDEGFKHYLVKLKNGEELIYSSR